jgi:uncharacterized protein with HEPN domain
MQRDASFLFDMRQAAGRIVEFMRGGDIEQFRADSKTQSAVIHQFLLIGEISKRVSEEFRRAHPSVPWSAMARMRDKLIHHYRGVDLEEVYRAANVEVPKLLAFLESQVPRQGASDLPPE